MDPLRTGKLTNDGIDRFGAGIVNRVRLQQLMVNENTRAMLGRLERFHYYETRSTWLQRRWWALCALAERCRDAWLVLTGRADIADPEDD